MPSRRTVLSATGSVIGGVIAGCLSTNRGVSGYVQLKSIEGWYAEADGGGNDPVLTVHPGSPPELNYLDPDWEDRFDDLRKPIVDDDLRDEFARTYEAVEYTVGVCSENWRNDWKDDLDETVCHNAPVSRAEFNMVQVSDEVRASFADNDLTIHSREGEGTFEWENESFEWKRDSQ